jgi:hypothetical protein
MPQTEIRAMIYVEHKMADRHQMAEQLSYHAAEMKV